MISLVCNDCLSTATCRSPWLPQKSHTPFLWQNDCPVKTRPDNKSLLYIDRTEFLRNEIPAKISRESRALNNAIFKCQTTLFKKKRKKTWTVDFKLGVRFDIHGPYVLDLAESFVDIKRILKLTSSSSSIGSARFSIEGGKLVSRARSSLQNTLCTWFLSRRFFLLLTLTCNLPI